MLDDSLDCAVLAGSVAALKDQYDLLSAFNDVFLQLHELDLEDATKLNVIIFDKTGTLTMGKPEVVDLVVASGATAEIM
jgi:magnesium-transporting ATPase (P-type)